MSTTNTASGTNFFAKVQADDDISSLSDFESFVQVEEGQPKYAFSNPRTSRINQYAGPNVRPGFKLKIASNNEKLRNAPKERNEFEITPSDTIPFATYRRMSFDPVIQFNMLLLRGWVAGLKFSIESTNPEIKAVAHYVLESAYTDLVRDLIGALAYGFAFGEKVWQREKVELKRNGEDGSPETVFSGDIISLNKIKFIDPDADIKYYKDKKDNISKITQQQATTLITVKRQKLVWFALDREFSGVFGRSRFKAVYDEWYYYQIMKQQMLRHVQRTGSPPLKVRYPDGTSQLGASDLDYFGSDNEQIDNVEIAELLAESFLNQGVILLPSERDDETREYLWDVSFDTVENADTNPFIAVLKLLAKRIAEGMGVPSSLGQGESNLAEVTAQSELLIVVVEDLVEQIERVIKTDIIDQVVAYNFGPEAVQDVEFKIDKTGLGRRKHIKDIYNNALRLAMSKQNELPASFPDLLELGRELGIKQKPFVDQFFGSTAETDGENPEVQKRQDEDSNDRNRANPTDRDPKKESPKDDQENTGEGT